MFKTIYLETHGSGAMMQKGKPSGAMMNKGKTNRPPPLPKKIALQLKHYKGEQNVAFTLESAHQCFRLSNWKKYAWHKCHAANEHPLFIA